MHTPIWILNLNFWAVGGPDQQELLALVHNTTDGVEIQILSSFSNHTCDHPSPIPNETSILVSGHYSPNECIPDLKHCNTEVILWKEQVFILAPIRNGVALIKFEHNQSHCYLQYVNHTTPQVMQDCNPVHIYGNNRLIFIACLNLSDSSSYIQFLGLDFDFNRFNITFFPISPRKQVFTLKEFDYIHEKLSCCLQSLDWNYLWDSSSLAAVCSIDQYRPRSLDLRLPSASPLSIHEPKVAALSVPILFVGVIAVTITVTLVAITGVVIRRKRRWVKTLYGYGIRIRNTVVNPVTI